MRTIDLTPLYRSTVGFDRMASMLDTMASEGGAGYPPYNIEKTAEHGYRITLAVAGFTDADISIETREGDLVITGGRADAAPTGDEYKVLYRGIAERAFERRFKLAEHVRAVSASLENGLLHVELIREVPEALKPRKIAIQSSDGRQQALAAE